MCLVLLTEQVTVSQRVEDTPAVIVSSSYGYSANMERIIKAQTLSDSNQASMLMGGRTMEINPRHPIVHELNSKVSPIVRVHCRVCVRRGWGG